MKTVFVVIEKSWNGNRIHKVFSDKEQAEAYKIECIGPDEFYDFDSTYQYWVEEWEVNGQTV